MKVEEREKVRKRMDLNKCRIGTESSPDVLK